MTGIDYQSLFWSIPGKYLILKPEFNFTIIEVSESYLQATMTKRDEIIGKGLFEIFPDNPNDISADGVSNLRASLNYVLRNKDSHTMAIQKYDIRRPDGIFEERYWNPLNYPVLNEKGDITLIVHRVDDVTDFINLKKEQSQKDLITTELRTRLGEMEIQIYSHLQEIQEMNKKLLMSNQELESFTEYVSHDLRAPLRSIMGYAKMVEEDYSGKLDEEGIRLLGRIQINIQRMGRLIDDLLTFSKLSKQTLSKADVDMGELLDKVLSDLLKADHSKAEIKAGILLNAPADKALITQVLINLISNAIKYSSKVAQPLIEINSERVDGEVIYSVKDNGAGFNMDYSDKLFGVFQRLHHADEFEGTGVGLAIVKRIVERHGGKVWAKGKIGEGAVFFFSLPLMLSV